MPFTPALPTPSQVPTQILHYCLLNLIQFKGYRNRQVTEEEIQLVKGHIEFLAIKEIPSITTVFKMHLYSCEMEVDTHFRKELDNRDQDPENAIIVYPILLTSDCLLY